VFSGTIEAPFAALLPLVCSAQGLLSGRAMNQETKTCTRCGGAVRTLRRFTRSGSAVSVLVCQVCRYTVFVAGSRAASSRPPTPTSRADWSQRGSPAHARHHPRGLDRVLCRAPVLRWAGRGTRQREHLAPMLLRCIHRSPG